MKTNLYLAELWSSQTYRHTSLFTLSDASDFMSQSTHKIKIENEIMSLVSRIGWFCCILAKEKVSNYKVETDGNVNIRHIYTQYNKTASLSFNSPG